MLLDTYEQRGLFYNTNFKEVASTGAFTAYRGDLVLVEGEIADALGRRKPPSVVLKGAVLLADDAKLKLVSGSLDEVVEIESFLDMYGTDLAPDLCAVFYVVNIGKPLVAAVGGMSLVLIPLTDGLVWNELAEELKLEKSDFKGQSSGDKVLTVFNAFADYAPKYERVSLDEAFTRTIEAKRAERGAV